MGNKTIISKRQQERRKKRLLHQGVLLTLGGALLLGAVFLVLSSQPGKPAPVAIEVHGSPSLKVDRESVDLGDQHLGQTVEVSFLVSNVGDQPLQFSEAPYIEVLEGC